MIFSTTTFLLYFLPIFLLVYHLSPKNLRNYVILLFSIFFYSWGAPKFIFILLCSTIIDFYLVRTLHATNSDHRRKLFLTASLVLNLGLLLYFKYSNFFVDSVNLFLQKFGVEPMVWIKVALPIGISFYTFQTITYVVDVYRRKEEPLNNLSDYLMYILSFPQMIAGPIVRFGHISKEILSREEKIDDKLLGFYRFCIGLAKKVLVANVMGEQADLIFDGELETLSMPNAWLGMIAYTFQIYFDFSGYSDMAIGLGRMIGFHFPENFNSPYISKSITEFWRRWHITLGDFMRDYLYIPLGGNRVKTKSRLFFNLWFVFLISGLWHGASWNFVLWGAFHGFWLIMDRVFLLRLTSRIPAFFSTSLCFFLVMIGWVTFRIEDFSRLKIYYQRLFSFEGNEALSLTPEFPLMLIVAVIFSFIAGFVRGEQLQAYVFDNNELSLSEHAIRWIASLVLFVLCVAIVNSSDFNPFIYFRF